MYPQAIFGGWLGSVALAAQITAATICSVIYMASIGLGGAASALVGASLGRGNLKLTKQFVRISIASSVGLHGVIAACLVYWREQIAGVQCP